MHILIYADGHSAITRRWLESVQACGHQITLATSFPCEPPGGLAGFHYLPVAFSSKTGKTASAVKSSRAGVTRRLISTFRGVLLALRYQLGPTSVHATSNRFQSLVRQINPDLVHALRIPFEGMLAGFTPEEYPLVVSIWGNDLTLHAPRTAAMGRLTRQALRRADGMHADAARDLRLAKDWGFAPDRPQLLVPTNGGIDLEMVLNRRQALPPELDAKIPTNTPLIINPRGVRTYTRTDTFFQSLPLIFERRPNVTVLCPSMAGQSEAENWYQRLNQDKRIVLLPWLSQEQLWALFSRSMISLSITTHDGTPNTLLESMSCGSYPIAGDIEAIREWIKTGENGTLVDPGNPALVTEAVVHALDDEQMRSRAAILNLEMVRERAEVRQIRPKIDAFYRQVAKVR
jgi:glycosyltransferase involved in cell wall biosynthesis